MERVLGLLGNKVNFSNLVIYSLSILTSCQFTNEPNREISRDVFQNRGVWGQAFPPLPSPSPFHFFCSRSNFPAITRLETLTTQLATQVTLKLMLETPLWKQLLSLTMKGGRRGRGVSSRVLRFTSYESNIYVFTLAQIKVVQNVKNVTLVPFCKTECFDYILAS